MLGLTARVPFYCIFLLFYLVQSCSNKLLMRIICKEAVSIITLLTLGQLDENWWWSGSNT